MTREEAIERLEFLKGIYSVDTETALDMAISALSADDEIIEPSDLISRADALKTVNNMYDACDTEDMADYRDLLVECFKVLPSVSAERCGECRKELEDLLKQYAEVASKKKDIVAQHICDGISLSLGSIPAERVGVWIRRDNYKVMGEGYLWHCSLCDQSVYQDSSRDYPSERYCPNCGAKMGGE